MPFMTSRWDHQFGGHGVCDARSGFDRWGIPEVAVHGETGLLVPFEPVSAQVFEPIAPEEFSKDLAAAVNCLLDDPATMRSMGEKARERVEQYFSWTSIAQRTLGCYRELTKA
jgi:alpha-maltose-1-phosphate synthase